MPRFNSRHIQPTSITIAGEANDDAPTFTNVVGNISSRPATIATVPWSPDPWLTAGDSGPNQRTPDITSIIQEIVDRPGWSPGNSLALVITGTGKRTAKSYNGSAAIAPQLRVQFAANRVTAAVDDVDTTFRNVPVTTMVLSNDDLGD